jgi:hypothetical protein
MAGTFTAYAEDNRENHLMLLSLHPVSGGPNSAWKESIKTSPVFTSAAGKAVDLHEGLPGYREFGLLGQQLEVIDPVICAIETTPADEDGRVFLNGDAPLSAFICGVQGAGKSNSLAVMLGKSYRMIPHEDLQMLMKLLFREFPARKPRHQLPPGSLDRIGISLRPPCSHCV